MVTLVKDWYIVYLWGKPDGTQMNERWGRVLWGTIVMDGSGQWQPGNYLCSAPISKDSESSVHTKNGKVYSLIGAGQTVELPVTELEKLQEGYHPLKLLELANRRRQHLLSEGKVEAKPGQQ